MLEIDEKSAGGCGGRGRVAKVAVGGVNVDFAVRFFCAPLVGSLRCYEYLCCGTTKNGKGGKSINSPKTPRKFDFKTWHFWKRGVE